MARRLAILIGNQRFAPDSGFAELRGPHNDVDALAAILTDPARGGFELAEPPLKDASRLAIMDVIRLALHEATADDTLLIHYSGHGKPDGRGRLHFAVADSKASRLRDTALRAEDLDEAVGESRCGAVILLLDCCYAGAIGAQYGGGIRGETAEAIQQQLRETAKARGLFILTSSTAWQTSEEVEDERDGRVMGRFTRAVAARLNAVAPDLPAEVRFSHLAAHVETAFPGQDTRKFFVDAQGDPVIARLPPRETAEERRERRLTGWMADGVLPPHVYGPAFEAIHGRGPAALVSLVARLLDAPGMTAQAFVAGVRNALPGEVPPPFPPIIERGPPAVPVASPAVPAPPASVSRRPRRWLLGLVASAAVAALVYSQVPPSTTEPPTRAEATATKPETAAPAPAVSASPDKPAVATALAPPKPAPGPTDTKGSNAPATAPPAASPTTLAPATPSPGGPDKPAGTAPATSSTPATPAVPSGPITPTVATPAAAPPPGTVLPRDCSVCPDTMVVIPGGTFTMGSPKTDKDSRDDERPQRQVTVASFAAGRFEVTRREFAAFIKDNPQRDVGGCWNWESADWQRRAERNWSNPGFAGYVQSDDDPVVCVSWTDAKDYVAWLNGKAGREVFRLLTEAEWEWAARAQSDPKKPATRFGFGDNETELCDHGNVPDATAKRYNPSWTVVGCIDDYPYTAPVGRFRRNAFGLHDMHGNVWEWVEDAFGTYPMNPTDSRALMPARSEYHVLRGGSWYLDWRHCRSATRNWYAPGIRNGDVGFRLARSLF